VAPPDIRRHVRVAIEGEFPRLRVLSYQDLVPSLVLQPIGEVG
jgi:type III secretory pathway component EscV